MANGIYNRREDVAGRFLLIKEKKMYWDEDILRIKNEVRRHNREGINDEETAEADAEPDETTEETLVADS